MKVLFLLMPIALAAFMDYVQDINYDNWKEKVMAKPSETHMFVLWQDAQCKECRRGATEMVKLSQFMAETEGSPKIARVDCRASKGLCNTFRADKLPYMLLFRNRHVYKYEGAINAEQIEAFLAEGFQAHQIHDNLEAFVIEGERIGFEKQQKEAQQKYQTEEPLAYQYLPWIRTIENAYDEVFRRPTVYTFNFFGKDAYSKFTKVSVFSLLVVIPLVLTSFVAFTSLLVETFDPAPELIPAQLPPQKLQGPQTTPKELVQKQQARLPKSNAGK